MMLKLAWRVMSSGDFFLPKTMNAAAEITSVTHCSITGVWHLCHFCQRLVFTVQASPLTLLATRVTLSDIPPFISNEFLTLKKSHRGVSLLKHVVSHRRQLFMLLNRRDKELNLCFNVRIDEHLVCNILKHLYLSILIDR